MDPLEKLKQADRLLKRMSEEKARAKLESERNALVQGVAENLPQMVEPLLHEVSENARFHTEQVVEAIRDIQIAAPQVEVKVDVPKAEVTVNQTPIEIPEIKTDGIVSALKQAIADGFSKIKIPTPEVTVNTPAQEPVVFPEFPQAPDSVSLKGVNPKNPLPVQLMDMAGKPFFPGAGGAGGGRGDFFTIKDIQTSSGTSIIDNDGFVKVTGNFAVTASGSSTVSLVNSDGTYYNSDNPLPVTGTFTPADVQAVSQVSGATWSVSVNDIFRTTVATNLINADDRLRVSLETGGSGLTDSELRASAVPVSQVSGVAWSVSVSGASATLGVVTINPDGDPVYGGTSSGGTVQVQDSYGSSITSFGSGDSKGLAVAIVDASGNQITSFGGGTQYADGGTASIPTGTVAFGDTGEESGNLFALATFSGVTSSGTLRTVQAVDSVSSVNVVSTVGLTDTQLRASTLDVRQVSGSSDSVNVLGTVTVSATDLDIRDLDFATDDVSVYQVSGHRWSTEATQSGTWNIGTVTTLTGITNSLAANIVDSGGVAYSGSNPLPINDAGGSLTVDGTVAVSDITNSLKSALIDSTGVQYSGSNPVPTYIASGSTASISVVALDRDGNPLTTGPIAQGDEATALRVVHAGNSAVSVTATQTGTWNINAVTSVTNSVAAAIVDSGGVQYSTTNPLPIGDAGGSLTVDGTVAVSSITNSVAASIVDSTGVMHGSANPFHIAVHDSFGSTITSFGSGDSKGLAVAIVDASGNQITSFGGGTQYAEGATASTYTGTAMIFAEASSDAAKVVSSVDPLPATLATALSSTIDSILSRPISLRGNISTAYATLSTNSETTLLSASAGNYLDLVWVKFSNTSSGAVTIDLRDSSAGSIVDTYEVPANGVVGVSMAVPYPQGNQGNAWTVDYNDSDLSNTTVYVSGMFHKTT